MRRSASVLIAVGLSYLLGYATLSAALHPVGISVDAGSILSARDTVEVRITNIPDDVEEFELLLIANRAKYRLTPQLFGKGATIRWRVPRIDTTHAVLLVRGGSHDKGERDLVRSRPFEIIHRHGEPLQYVVRQGEAWIEEELTTPLEATASRISAATLSLQDDTAEQQRERFDFRRITTSNQSFKTVLRLTANSSTILSRSPLVVPQRK